MQASDRTTRNRAHAPMCAQDSEPTTPGTRVTQHGMALILVVLVLSALLLIGTPFILSMKLQEQGAVQTVAEERARLASESARNHALAHLFQTHPSLEEGMRGTVRSSTGTNRNSGDAATGVQTIEAPEKRVDDLSELEVTIPRELNLTPVAEALDEERTTDTVTDPYVLRRGNDRILAVEVEDEQGKVNLNSAPPILLGNLLGGTQLSEDIKMGDSTALIPVVDTSVFETDDDPDTVDGVLVILNPLIYTMEAVSYRGKTDTHLTGCFRGEYLSVPQDHYKGWPIFDLRAFKVYLHRYYNLEDGELRTYRTPQAMREIAEWSIVPYFMKNLAVLGLNVRNIEDFGLTPEMLLRAGIDQMLFERNEEEYDEDEYRKARKKLKQLRVPQDMVELVENARGRKAIIDGVEMLEKLELGQGIMSTVGKRVESEIKKELKRIKTTTRDYFPKAVEAYKEVYDQPGMETFSARDFEEIRDLITTTSIAAAEWTDEQAVIGEISKNSLLGFPSLQVANYSWFNPGTLVRIRSLKDPAKVEYHLAMQAMPSGPGGSRMQNAVFSGGIILKEPLRFDYEEREAVVAAMLRSPVNINTAPGNVIAAVLSGISVVDVSARVRHLVDSKEARALTEKIIENRPILGFSHFKQIVEDARKEEILDTDRDVRLLLTNAQNPNHRSLSVSSVGFCYETSNVYSIESSGVINNPAGLEMARHRIREIVEVAPPDPLKIQIQSQADFAYRQFLRPSADRSTWPLTSTWLPGREGNRMITHPTPLHQKAWESPSAVGGTLKALTAELADSNQDYGFGPISFAPVEHFPDTIEGIDTALGPHVVSTVAGGDSAGGQGGSGAAGGSGAPGSGAGATVEVEPDQSIAFVPSTVEMWVKPNWASRSQDRTFFDTIANPELPERNRIRLFYDGEEQSLVLQVMDDAAPPRSPDAPGPTSIPREVSITGGGEIRYPVTSTTFANDTWYHISATWGSSRPGDQLLMIDGHPVGDHKWMTRLSAPLAITGNRVSVERNAIAKFPETWPAEGSLLVGTEVIDYEGGRITRRGSRGTVRQHHPRGTPVRLFGYGVDVVPSDPRANMATLGDALVVPQGGAKLAVDLPISYDEDMNVSTFARVTGVQNPGHYSGTTATIQVEQDPGVRGFPPQGYLFVFPIMQDSQGLWFSTGLWEYVKYQGVRPFQTANGGAGAEFYNLIHDPIGANKVDTTTLGGATVFRLIVHYVGIETDVDNLDELYPPSGVIQLDPGTGTTVTSANQAEWIYYWTMAEEKFFLGRPLLRGYGHRGFTGNLEFSDDLLVNGDLIWDNTVITPHTAGQEVVPVMRTTRPFIAEDDWVSVGESYGPTGMRKAEPRLTRIRIVRRTDLGTFFSFAKQPTLGYRVGGLPKLKKFPSGELPSITSSQMYFGGAPAAGLRGAGPLDALLDEIRISRSNRSDFVGTAFPVSPRGRMVLDEVPAPSGQPAGVKRRAIRTWFDKNQDVGTSGSLDKIRFVGNSKLTPLVDDGAVLGSVYERGHPRSFGLGKPEGLLAISKEVFHYTFEPEGLEAETRVQLVQDLPKDALFWEQEELEPGEPRFIDPARDLRSEAIPQIEIVITQGDLPTFDGFLEFINDDRKEVLYYERRQGNRLYNVLRGQLGTEVGSYVYQTQYRDRGGQLITNTNEYFLRLLDVRDLDLQHRSMLNTERQAGSLGRGSILALPHIPITRTAGPITTEALPLVDGRSFSSQWGYVILDDGEPNTEDEIIGYQQRQDNLLLLAQDDRTGHGIFRGRFGTQKQGQIGSDLPVVGFPVRYHDHFDAQVESPALMYWQRAYEVPGAMWDRVHWHEEEQRNTTFDNETWVLVRFDGAPDWDSEPTNEPGGLYLFKDGAETNALGIEASRIELRVMFRQPLGAYGRNSTSTGGGWNDTWKHSPVLDSIQIDYRKQWRVIHRENLPF